MVKTATKAKSKDYTNYPFVSNYPPLHEWLEKHEARCMWQVPLSPDAFENHPAAYVENWIFPANGRLVIIVVHAQKHGWEIYTPTSSNQIAETIEDATRRLGLENL